jgi:hypothetical protein
VTYRDAACAALRDLDAYAEAAAEEAQTGPLAIRARLRADLDALDRDAYQARATGALVDPAAIPPMRRLGAAIGDAGRIIESLPADERHASVRRVMEGMTERERLDILIGLLVGAHEARLAAARESDPDHQRPAMRRDDDYGASAAALDGVDEHPSKP